jgi:diguanylate cyclase (GGDEF)-like protein
MIPEDTSIIGINVDEALARSSVQFSRPEHFSKHLVAALESRESSESYEIQMSDGRTVTELDYPVMDTEGRFVGHLWIYEDVTRERQTAEQLVYLAERDPLTGLYNRHRFQSELDRTLIEAQRNNSRCAVIFFDLDEFKSINDTLGHRAGDTVLVRVAGEVSAVVRRNEILARLGGDEFAILMPNINTNEAEILADRVVKAIAQTPFRYESNSLRLTTSLGIALYPEQAADAEELVARADIAMYQAKQAGKNTWRVYRDDNAGNIEMLGRMNWNERISRALENQHLTLHYHGIYHADSCQLAHVEALVRMIDEDDPENLILPGNFIPMAEKSGRILDIDRWVIREATGHLARHPEVSAIAVNVSARSLGEPSLPQFIAEQLKVFDVKSGRLIFELTETDAVNDLHDTRRLIEALRHMGCLVCLDDFGTGFSSFAYLKHLHADILKIDGMFIRDLHKHHDNQVFVQAIVNIARGLGKRVIAEYVENQNDLDLLKQIGVDMVQGYYLDKPAPDHPVFSKPH